MQVFFFGIRFDMCYFSSRKYFLIYFHFLLDKCLIFLYVYNEIKNNFEDKMPRQYNLSLTQTYKLIDSFYGSLEENGTMCENCGALIANIAVVEGQTDKSKYYIGMDCAETLTGIKDDLTLEYVHKVNFNVAKQYRSRILKAIKKAKENNLNYKLNILENTEKNWKGYEFNALKDNEENINYRWWKLIDTDVFNKYVYPMTKDLCNN